MLSELSLYEELSVMKTDHAFARYVLSYKVEIIERKDPINQLKANKSSIKDLFSDLLSETKGFNYQITLKALLKHTNSMEKLNLGQIISTQKQKQ